MCWFILFLRKHMLYFLKIHQFVWLAFYLDLISENYVSDLMYEIPKGHIHVFKLTFFFFNIFIGV